MAAWNREERPHPHRALVGLRVLAFAFAGALALALPRAGLSSNGQTTSGPMPGARSESSLPDPLHGLDAALKTLTARVSPAVVQVLVSGYGSVSGEDEESAAAVVERQHSVGSGVIVDANGYIVTNAHVVRGAERIEVLLTRPGAGVDSDHSAPADQSLFPAVLVGASSDFDLAVLKVDAGVLPTLPFADFREVTQGQLALAVGSPMGLENSVTLGVISSTARQPDPDSSLVFVQTDAPINPGNSGGALVDVDGHLIGINTFILSQAGGSEGLGFAIPAPIVEFVYQSLRRKGHVERRTVGLSIQLVTPTLARGLGLDRPYGIIVADVTPGGPAEQAGVRIGDVILEANGSAVTNPAELDAAVYLQELEAPFAIEVLRGGESIRIDLVPVDDRPPKASPLDRIDPEKDFVPRLGVLAVTLTADLEKELGDLRIHTGVVVIAREQDAAGTDNDLVRGDVIHSINGRDVVDIDGLRGALSGLKRGDAVVLQVERDGGMQFSSFLMN
jgi:serine protease Do